MLIGARLGPYEILDPLGSGGMGEVYRARDTRLRREVALKVLPEELGRDPERLARFEREARAVAALNHPNIVTVFSVDEVAGVRFITMEVVEGRTLRELIPEHGMPVGTLLQVAIPLADALASAHARGVIHRDLKPANVMVTAEGRVKVLDFGIAKMTTAGASNEDSELTVTDLTDAGRLVGTVPYMSPEQVEGRPVDHRSDIFSLGTMLHQMATGERPFTGDTPASVMSAILRDTPTSISVTNPALPAELARIVRRCLRKDPQRRYPSADELRAELKALESSLAPSRPARLSRKILIAIAAAVVAAAAAAGWLWHGEARTRWALETAVPEITRLVDEEQYGQAAVLLREARAVLPQDPTLDKLWLKATGEATIETVPPGAEVSVRPYTGDPDAWESLGETPLQAIRIPNAIYVVRIRKPGFADTTLLDWPPIEQHLTLQRDSDVPPGMVPVAGRTVRLEYPLHTASAVAVDDYLIDRTEVTNEAYKKFLDAGGYRRPELWQQPFVKGGRTLPFAEAVSLFVDATGRPGPATWQAGGFPKGSEHDPVTGVSWYEAAAYAQFAGKSLPTAYHWTNAAETIANFVIIPRSNFGLTGVRDVGQGAPSGWGTVDMAGNAKEWCWNESFHGERFIFGGGYDEPTYMFIQADAASPWQRRSDFGFRCVELAAPASEQAAARLEVQERDFSKETPVSDEAFAAYKALYAYDRTDLDAEVEGREPGDDWIHETVTIDSAYGDRFAVHLFLPKNAAPPYAPVIYFPGSNAQYIKTFEPAFLEDRAFLPRSGRALVFPIYRSTFERQDGWQTGEGYTRPALWRDHVIMWSKDLSRTVDYLQTRDDIDSSRLAYLGYSWGAGLAPILLSVDDRFKVAVLWSGGFWFPRYTPESYPFNFAPHMTTPALVLSDRYDTFLPEVTAQLPLFRSLGTPEKDKRRVVFDTGHGALPLKEAIRETLDWLDRYLGPVKR